MNRIRINNMQHITSTTGPAYINLDIDVELSNLPDLFSYDDIIDALYKAFDPAVFGKSNKFTKVIYNGPATIILWDDGIKTVVKCKEGDPYSHEAGFALAFLKHLIGNDFHRYLREAMKGAVKDERKSRETGERKA